MVSSDPFGISIKELRLGRKAAEISAAVTNDWDDVEESVLTPILVTLEFGFEYSS